MKRYQVGKSQGDRFVVNSEYDDLRMAQDKCAALNSPKQMQAKCCDADHNVAGVDQAIKLIEYHKQRIEVLCDHYNLDPQEWLADE